MEALITTPIPAVAWPIKVHFKRLLVATDFSPASEVGLSYAMLLARLFHAEITLVHAMTASENSGADRRDQKAGWMEATEQLHSERFRVEAHGTTCASVCRVGDPPDVIVQTVADCSSDLLVLGGVGQRPLSATGELGSTAAFIMRSIPCPTLLIGNETVKQTHPISDFRRLLFASSFRGQPGPALAVARTVARACNASIDVVHVRQADEQTSLPMEELTRYGERIVADLNRNGTAATLHLLTPPAGKALIEFAKQRSAGLIIFGIEHKAIHPTSHSMISDVVQHAPCPVLTVPGVA